MKLREYVQQNGYGINWPENYPLGLEVDGDYFLDRDIMHMASLPGLEERRPRVLFLSTGHFVIDRYPGKSVFV